VNRSPRLLVTGFGPFPGIPRNPSAVVAGKIAGSVRWRSLGFDVRVAVLSTTYAALERELMPALSEHAPDALLMIGVAGRAREVRVETRGRNRVSLLLPDAAKVRPARLALAKGPPFRTSAAKPARQVETLRRHGFRTRASIDAGPYLCNASYFTALDRKIPVLFVHIPKPGRAVSRRAGARPGPGWHDRLAAALADVAVDLLRQTRNSAV
jgi:pyroglutamyl-peptidase